eukprot:9591856-Ditylum_brightwellii.AAC.1
MKAEYTRVKNKIEKGIANGDDNKADLGDNMVSTCTCLGCCPQTNIKQQYQRNSCGTTIPKASNTKICHIRLKD